MTLPPSDLAPEAPDGHDLGRRARAVGAVLWGSFLAASAGTMFFFAFISPDDLLNNFPEGDRIDHVGVYTLGFFGLWLLSALSASIALYLHGLLGGRSTR
jgi:hypothetical protein